MRLLIVEDEVRITELLRVALTRSGFVVDAVGLCEDTRAALSDMPYDAAILDLGLPDGDGIALLRKLRSGGIQVPILVLTARDAVEDRVSGLDTGADNYVVKPFAMSELIARTKALLRRPGGALGTALSAGNITFDTIGRDVRVDETRERRCARCRIGADGRAMTGSRPTRSFCRSKWQFRPG
jgi:DNA-binding response OmpR family regulator